MEHPLLDWLASSALQARHKTQVISGSTVLCCGGEEEEPERNIQTTFIAQAQALRKRAAERVMEAPTTEPPFPRRQQEGWRSRPLSFPPSQVHPPAEEQQQTLPRACTFPFHDRQTSGQTFQGPWGAQMPRWEGPDPACSQLESQDPAQAAWLQQSWS